MFVSYALIWERDARFAVQPLALLSNAFHMDLIAYRPTFPTSQY